MPSAIAKWVRETCILSSLAARGGGGKVTSDTFAIDWKIYAVLAWAPIVARLNGVENLLSRKRVNALRGFVFSKVGAYIW